MATILSQAQTSKAARYMKQKLYQLAIIVICVALPLRYNTLLKIISWNAESIANPAKWTAFRLLLREETTGICYI